MNIYLMTALPLLTGFAAIMLIGSLQGSRFEVKGVVGPYFGALAIMFGLFASLMAGDSWRKVASANTFLATEVNALRAINLLSDALGTDGDELRSITGRYVSEELLAEADYIDHGAVQLAELPSLIVLHKLIFKDKAELAAIKAQLFHYADQLRTARTERQELKRNHLSSVKLTMLFLLGAITQVAVAMCHSGSKSATNYTVGLFTIAFALTVHFIVMFDSAQNFAEVVDLSILSEVT